MLLLDVLGGETRSPPPVWLMRQAGRYLPEYRALRSQVPDFLSFCYTPQLAVEVTLQPVRRFGVDAAILFSDILVVPDAMGQRVRFVQGEGPRLEPLRNRAAVEALSALRIDVRLAAMMETVATVRAHLPRETALIGFCGAPWTLATYMVEGGPSRDFATVKAWAARDPEGFSALIDRLVTATADLLTAQVDAGADVVQVFDTWAGVLPAAGFRRWSIEPTKALVARLRARHPGVPVIGFPRGAGVNLPAYVRETGVTAVGLDSGVAQSWAARELQPLCAVQGNLDPVTLLAGGPALDREIDTIIDALGGGPLVFNLGHGILPPTPPEHVARLVERVRREGAR
ncbi:MAG: uroporphyrinogen decarboxylase [Alphaproteobacteria bacterium]|nr:uroporphyrinogen decarboxylase [Alphaproteobacteria bacterium]